MQTLFAFLFRNRVFGVFIFLEAICIWLLFFYNDQYNSYFFNSSNAIIGTVYEKANNSKSYFRLLEVNQSLAEENASLRMELARRNMDPLLYDTLYRNFIVIPSRVVNNEFRGYENYLTIDKGSLSDISPGMGVITKNGVVGIIKSVSEHYSTITSVLNQKVMISALLKNSNTLCTVQWNSEGPLIDDIKYIPRHIPIRIGEAITTSGFSAIFPKDIAIGKLLSFELSDELPFYRAKIQLSADFSSLDYVYIIKNEMKQELDSLQSLL